MTGSLTPIPRLPYAALVGVGALVSVVAGNAITAAAGGDMGVQIAVSAVLVLGAVLAGIPLIGPPLVTSERFGMVVLGVSGIRTMLAMGGMLMLIEAQGLPKRPVVYGLLSGTLMLMVIEAAAAVWTLGRRDRSRKLMNATGSSV